MEKQKAYLQLKRMKEVLVHLNDVRNGMAELWGEDACLLLSKDFRQAQIHFRGALQGMHNVLASAIKQFEDAGGEKIEHGRNL